MGTVFKLPIVYSTSLLQTLEELRAVHGFSVFAAHPRPGSVPLFEVNFRSDTCVVFGNEGHGISANLSGRCTGSVIIPMTPGIDSFNVACASAIVLYEAMRQRIPR
jgi:TrmH family RNA methyltransferase